MIPSFEIRNDKRHNEFVEAMEARSYVVYVIKDTDFSPDFCIMLPGGKNVFLRFGARNEWTLAHDRKLRKLGHGVFEVDSASKAIQIIKKITGRP